MYSMHVYCSNIPLRYTVMLFENFRAMLIFKQALMRVRYMNFVNELIFNKVDLLLVTQYTCHKCHIE